MTASPAIPTPRRCAAIKVDGSCCGARPLRGRRFCRFHDPDRKAEHLRVSARGGAASWRTRLDRASADTAVGGLLSYLTECMTELRRPGLSPDEVGRLRAAVYAASVAIKVVETAELGAELERLRDLVDSGIWRGHDDQA